MKTTVIYDGENGNVLATIGEYDATRVRAETFEVLDGERVDRVDLSGETPQVVTSSTPASWQAQLEAAVKRSDEKRASLETRVLTMFNDMMRGDGADEDSEGTV